MTTLTLRYTHAGHLSDDLSTILYQRTQIPHVKCFLSGKYLLAGLSSRAYREKHSCPAMTGKLKSAGLHLVESMEARAFRTVISFRPPKLICDRPTEQLKEEISAQNGVKVEVQLLKSSSPLFEN